MVAQAQPAADFEAIIQTARSRKKNEALASKIFGNVIAAKSNSNRRESAPFARPGIMSSNSMTSRAGIKKRISPAGPAPGNINGEWTHDLYSRSARSAPTSPAVGRSANGAISAPSSPAPGSLAARVQDPRKRSLANNALANRISTRAVRSASSNAISKHERRRQQRLTKALEREVAMLDAPALSAASAAKPPLAPASMMSSPAFFKRGMTIRGMAGPFVVMAQNFAPGTTAADIESAMGPVGGVIESCRILKEWPIVTAEIVFESKEGADNVVATFNQQTADGRMLNVYNKFDNTLSKIQPSVTQQQSGGVIDGSMGFDDSMEMKSDDIAYTAYPDVGNGHRSGNGNTNGNGAGYGRQQPQRQTQRSIPTGPAAMSGGGGDGGGSLYSDRLVSGSRRGRGFNNRG